MRIEAQLGDPDYQFTRLVHAGDPSGLWSGTYRIQRINPDNMPIYNAGSATAAVTLNGSEAGNGGTAPANTPDVNNGAVATNNPVMSDVPIPAVHLIGQVPGWLQWALIALAIFLLWKWAKGLK